MYTVYQTIIRYSDDGAQKLNIYRLKMSFSILALVSALDSHVKPDSETGGLICIECWYQGQYEICHAMNDLFITYFQAEKMRIYVKHNFNMNIFIANNSYHCSPLSICWLTIELTLSCRVHIPNFSVILQEKKYGKVLSELWCRYVLNGPPLIVPV